MSARLVVEKERPSCPPVPGKPVPLVVKVVPTKRKTPALKPHELTGAMKRLRRKFGKDSQ